MLIICPRPRGTVPLLTDERRLIIGRQSGHDGHEEHRHVQHGGDAQGDLLTRLGRDHEHKPAHKESYTQTYIKGIMNINLHTRDHAHKPPHNGS